MNMETSFDAIAEAHSVIAQQRVMADLEILTRDTEDLLRATAHDLSDQDREARSRLAAALERAKATRAELQEQALATAKAAGRNTDLAIRAHPYVSIGVAFGVGLLIGVLVIRSHRNRRQWAQRKPLYAN
jgi:ElaB/YqjD/DUF883 family membrane-anchored ribosome-binding protein